MNVDGLRKQDGNMQNEKKSREIKPGSVNALEIITKVSKENEKAASRSDSKGVAR